jgi:NAD(P)-dependent dehydrogenase (short-subunit alcohol dehydrogenase family)
MNKVWLVTGSASVGGRLTRPGSTPYHAAKWAVGGFTECLAQELSPFSVKACALEPGGGSTIRMDGGATPTV